MKKLILLCAATLVSAAAFALPTTDQVQEAVKAGNYGQAETLMQEVVAAKPKSAKAHYVYAEILAHDAKFDQAAAQAREARAADPAITFTDPAKFRNFEQELQREQAGPAVRSVAPVAQAAPVVQQAAPVDYQRASGGIPGWAWGLGIVVILFLVFRAVSRRAAMAAGSGAYAAPAGYGGAAVQPGYGPGYGQGYGPGYGQPGYGGAPGGGLLRTGLAAAGGVAAGMLAEKLIDEHRDGNNGGGFVGGSQGYDNGAGQAAADLEQRPIDFGSGDGWGGGDAGSSSSDDFTPSGDDSGGGW